MLWVSVYVRQRSEVNVGWAQTINVAVHQLIFRFSLSQHMTSLFEWVWEMSRCHRVSCPCQLCPVKVCWANSPEGDIGGVSRRSQVFSSANILVSSTSIFCVLQQCGWAQRYVVLTTLLVVKSVAVWELSFSQKLYSQRTFKLLRKSS